MKSKQNKYSQLYAKIDRKQLSEQALATLDKLRLATGNFRTKNQESLDLFQEFYDKLSEKKPTAIKGSPENKAMIKEMLKERGRKLAEGRKAKQKEKTEGKSEGNEIDANRPAKPFGWRMRGKHNYKKPTRADITEGRAYYEGRVNRADVKRKKYPMLERGGMAEEVYYVNDFYPNYDEDKIAQVLKDNGFKKVRKGKKYGWSNQPDVVVFQGDKNKAKEVLEKEFDNYISINEKDWGRKYEEGGEINGNYLNSISADKKERILKNIAKHYGISMSEAEAEVKDSDAEMLYEYIANDNGLRMAIYNDIENKKYEHGGMAEGGDVDKGGMAKNEETSKKRYVKSSYNSKSLIDDKNKASKYFLNDAEYMLKSYGNAKVEKVDNSLPDGVGMNYIVVIESYKKYAKGGYMAKGGEVHVVLNEGNGKIINKLYNDWNNVKTEQEYKKWVDEVRSTKFGTYGTITYDEVLKKFNFDNAPINSFHLKSFKAELKNALNKDYKYEDGGYMAKGGKINDKVWSLSPFSIGNTKYVLYYYDGEKTHKDGSPFIDIYLCKNKITLNERIKELKSKGYKEVPNVYNHINSIMADGGYMADGGVVDKMDFNVLNGLQGFNNGRNLNGLLESMHLSDYRFNKYADKDTVENVKESLKKLISMEFVEESGEGYKLTQKGANYRRENYNKYAKGGAIENQYEGRTAKDIWDNLTKPQRSHFILDHAEQIEGLMEREFESGQIRKAMYSDYKNLDPWIKNRFDNHTRQGQYEHGGEMDDEEGVDLFEDYEDQPKEVSDLLETLEVEDYNYDTLNDLLSKMKKIGYTFEFGLDAEPYDLRKIGQKGKSEFYAKGGKLGLNTYKLRAEGLNDFLSFLQTGMYMRMKSFTIEPIGVPEVIVTFVTDASLSEIKSKLKEVQDSHVMLETLKPIDEYTGERDEMMAKGGTIKVGDKVRSTTFKGVEGKVISKKGDMLFIEKYNALPNGDTQRDVLRISEVEKMAKGGEVFGDSLNNVRSDAKSLSRNYKQDMFIIEQKEYNFSPKRVVTQFTIGTKEDVDYIREKTIKNENIISIKILGKYSNGELKSSEEEILYMKSKYAKGGEVFYTEKHKND